MKITNKLKGYEQTEEIKDYIEKRLGFSLGRFSNKIATVDIRLQDENGPKGGIDQKCHITARLKKGIQLRVQSLEDRWETAIDVAANRISRMVARYLENQRAFRFKSGMFYQEYNT